MGIISRMRKQNAIYWPPASPDDFGRPSQGALVELKLTGSVNSRVRWEDKQKEFIAPDGTTHVSEAMVFVPVLPSSGGEVEVGGWLWLGDRADLDDEADPRNNAGAAEVKQVAKVPNFRSTEFLRTAYL